MQQRHVKVGSAEVQGEGTYVVVRRVTVAETKEIMRSTTDREAGLETYCENTEWVAARILEWNWTDEAGNPLPYPKNDPGVIDRLTNEELQFLNQAILGRSEQERKN